MSDWRFTTAELTALETDQEAHMMDICTIGAYHAVQDGYGIPTPTYTAGNPTICGLNENVRQEVQSRGEVVMVDAVLRLPVGTAVDSRDRNRAGSVRPQNHKATAAQAASIQANGRAT